MGLRFAKDAKFFFKKNYIELYAIATWIVTVFVYLLLLMVESEVACPL